MKTAKSIIVVLFVLLTAQIASAYYCPSTGRWLSRDPIGEPGFQNSQTASLPLRIGNSQSSSHWINRDLINELALNILTRNRKFVGRSQEGSLYCFVSDDPVGKFDVLGLSAADVKAITDAYWKLFDEMCKSKKCCPEKGWVQNMPWSSTLGCTKQANTVQDMLQNLFATRKSDDLWGWDVAYKPVLEGNDPGSHNYSIMGSDNPDDPIITLDTWHGCLITYTRDSTIAGNKGTSDDWKGWTSDSPGIDHPGYNVHKDCRRCDGKPIPPEPVLPPVRQPPWGLH